MRMILLALSALPLMSCSGPAENEPHPFDKYMINSNTMQTHDDAPPCSAYGCRLR